MANKEYVNKDKKKKSSSDFKDLEELKEKQVVRHNENKEIMSIYPVEETKQKGDKNGRE